MKRQLVLAALAAVILAAASSPAGAVTLDGKLLDGPAYRATLYGPAGMQFATVFFLGDRARAFLPSGEVVTLRLNGDEIGDPSFISATTLDGQTYRIMLMNSPMLFGPLGDGPGHGRIHN